MSYNFQVIFQRTFFFNLLSALSGSGWEGCRAVFPFALSFHAILCASVCESVCVCIWRVEPSQGSRESAVAQGCSVACGWSTVRLMGCAVSSPHSFISAQRSVASQVEHCRFILCVCVCVRVWLCACACVG